MQKSHIHNSLKYFSASHSLTSFQKQQSESHTENRLIKEWNELKNERKKGKKEWEMLKEINIRKILKNLIFIFL